MGTCNFTDEREGKCEEMIENVATGAASNLDYTIDRQRNRPWRRGVSKWMLRSTHMLTVKQSQVHPASTRPKTWTRIINHTTWRARDMYLREMSAHPDQLRPYFLVLQDAVLYSNHDDTHWRTETDLHRHLLVPVEGSSFSSAVIHPPPRSYGRKYEIDWRFCPVHCIVH